MVDGMKNKKKYCIFAAQYFPHMGGVERYTYNLSKQLIRQGNEVVIVTSNTGKLKAYEIMDGIPVFRLPCIDLLDGRYPVLKPTKEFFKIHKILFQKQFDMIIVNTRFYPHSLYGMIFAKMKRVKCITIEHGTSHLSVHSRFWDSIGGVYEHCLTKVDQLFCHDYYGVSEACNRWLQHFHIKAKGVLYNSIDLEEVELLKRSIEKYYRKKYNVPEEAIVITFTGRLLKEKGILSLLNVMERLHKEYENLYLFIAGDGDLEEEIEKRRTDYIIPLGRIEFKDIITLLTETDIFCLPSFSEGFSTSLLEAAACRCYIITTERGGARELLINQDYGTVIPNNNEATLYKAFKQVLGEAEKRKKAVHLTYDRLSTNFTWDIVEKQVEIICESNGKKSIRKGK